MSPNTFLTAISFVPARHIQDQTPPNLHVPPRPHPTCLRHTHHHQRTMFAGNTPAHNLNQQYLPKMPLLHFTAISSHHATQSLPPSRAPPANLPQPDLPLTPPLHARLPRMERRSLRHRLRAVRKTVPADAVSTNHSRDSLPATWPRSSETKTMSHSGGVQASRKIHLDHLHHSPHQASHDVLPSYPRYHSAVSRYREPVHPACAGSNEAHHIHTFLVCRGSEAQDARPGRYI
jgi:hypothetical protein